MRLDARKEDILDFIVRDFIRTALPVSSGRICKKRDFGASPATIRSIMQELDEAGYLYQPHTSAGRAPTDKGYKYFVSNLMLVKEPAQDVKRELGRIIENLERETDFAFLELSRVLAEHLHLFSGISMLNEGRVFGQGLPEVLREPEFTEHEMAVRFADFAENIHNNFRKFLGRGIEIGDGGFGMVSMGFEDSDWGRCVIFSAGPQRMNYEKATSLLRYASEDIKSKRKKHAGRR